VAKTTRPAKPTSLADAVQFLREAKARSERAAVLVSDAETALNAARSERDTAEAWVRQAEAWVLEMAGKD
jgi:hypothetical protein